MQALLYKTMIPKRQVITHALCIEYDTRESLLHVGYYGTVADGTKTTVTARPGRKTRRHQGKMQGGHWHQSKVSYSKIYMRDSPVNA